jgi:CDGSH-type Zn-finger protein
LPLRFEPQPWCDGNHARILDEAPDKLYFYKDGARREVTKP